MERFHARIEVEPVEHFNELRSGVLRPYPEAAGDLFFFENFDIASEDDAVLRAGDMHNFSVDIVIFVQSVETEHSEKPGQFSEMHVEDKPWSPKRVFPYVCNAGDVETFEYGIHRYSVAVPQAVRESDRVTVHEDEVDFRVRDSDRFNDGFHRWIS